MSIAYQYVTSRLDSALLEAEQWAPRHWSNCLIFLSEAQGSVRSCHAFGYESFGYLDKVPYLTSRLNQPGVAARAVVQFDSVDEALHNRNSISVYSKTVPSLRMDVLNITPEGTRATPILQREIDSMNEINCDDSIDEEPHARMKRITLAARRGKFAWQSASLSMSEGIEDARSLPAVIEKDPQELWNNYGCLLQTKHRYLHRPVRCNRKVFEERMYSFTNLDGFEASADPAEGSSDDDPDIDGPGPSTRCAKAPRLAEPARSPDLEDIFPRLDEAGRLMAEWLVSTMTKYIFICVVALDPAPGAPKMSCFQILSIKPKQAMVKTFDQAAPSRYGLRARIQPLEIWRANELTELTEELNCVVVSGPEDVDLLKICSTDPQNRVCISRVFQVPSDLDGTMSFSNPTPLAPACELQDDRIPVLCLLDEFENMSLWPRTVWSHTLPFQGSIMTVDSLLRKERIFNAFLRGNQFLPRK